nr:hypothetical protein [Tanacetum cinerariifolium]
MTLFNRICDNCIYGAGMPIICTACGGIMRGGLCLPCDLREKNLYNNNPNAYSFNNSNYFPQTQDEIYLCNLCGNNSHDGYDCQQQFPFVYEQEPSYNQNYDDNYFPHESPSYPCCDYCEGFHETFQCQPDNQNVDFSGSDQIQTLQYPDVNPPSPEINLKERAEYDQSTSTDRPILLNDNEDHHVQNKESLENSSEENVVSKTNQEPPQDSDIHQLIEECSIKVPEEQNALDSKLLSINLINSQRLDKKEQEVKNVVEQPAERGNCSIQSLQNFRVIHKSSISFKNTSQISSIHSVAPIQSTREPEHLLIFTTFSNPLFKDNDDLDSSDDESLPDEDVPAEEFKINSNPLCDEDKINSDKLDPHCFNIESDFVESLLNQIPKSDFDFKEEIRLIENLLYDNSFPRPPEELNAEIADTIIESIPLLPIPVQDGNSQQEEIDIVAKMDDVLPPSDENDDDLSNDSLLEEDNSIPPGIENDNPSIPRPPPEPPDDELDLEPDSGKDISAVVNKDVSDDENDDYFPFMFVI